VGIDITLDAAQEFSSLLDLIGRIYRVSIRERRKSRYSRPRFT